MKHPRLTIRRLMIGVALVGIVLGLSAWMERRSAEFRALRDHHDLQAKAGLEWRPGYCLPIPTSRGGYHAEMSYKYARAARYPWLPVAADPPEPEASP